MMAALGRGISHEASRKTLQPGAFSCHRNPGGAWTFFSKRLNNVCTPQERNSSAAIEWLILNFGSVATVSTGFDSDSEQFFAERQCYLRGYWSEKQEKRHAAFIFFESQTGGGYTKNRGNTILEKLNLLFFNSSRHIAILFFCFSF